MAPVDASSENPSSGGNRDSVPHLSLTPNIPARNEVIGGSADVRASFDHEVNSYQPGERQLAIFNRNLEPVNAVGRLPQNFRMNMRARVSAVRFNVSPEASGEVKFDLLAGILSQLTSERAKEIRSDENLQKELMGMFSELLVMIETPVSGDSARIKQKKDQIKEKLLGKKPTPEENKSMDLYLDSALLSIKKIKVVERLSQLAVQKPELASILEEANKEIEELEKAVKEGKITADEADKRFNEILRKVAEASGDEEAKKMLEEQKKEEEKQRQREKEFEQSGGYSEGASYETREEAQSAAYSTMSNAGFTVNINPENGLMEVTMPDDNGDFNFAIRIEKDNNGKFVYIVEDKYANKGEEGPYNGEELLRAADRRHIDAYLTYKLRPLIKAPDNANAVKDEELIKIGEKIIGSGEVRQYRIDGDYRRGLDGLAKLLAADDEKEPQLQMRVHKLALYLDRLDVGECRSLMNRLKDNADGLNVTKVISGDI